MAAGPDLAEALGYLCEGQTIVVWRLDSSGRSLTDLIAQMTQLKDHGISFGSRQESIDTTAVGGKLFCHVFGAPAEFERHLIRERTRAGLNAARARGRLGGRPRILDEKKMAVLRSLHKDPANSIRDLCRTMGISRATLCRCLRGKTSAEGGG